MSRLSLAAHELFNDRPTSIRALLRPVAAAPPNLQIRVQKHAEGQIIAASDGFDKDSSPTDRLFATVCARLFGQYYEIWTPDSRVRNYYLYQNYFHLYALPSKTERDQLFCFHAEPQEPMIEIGDRVRASPHIHVKAREDRLKPLAKAHLPVCYSIADRVLGSLEAFDRAFAETVEVIRHEVVDRFT